MLKMVDGTGIIGVDMICPLGVSTPQPPNYDRVEIEGAGMLVLPNSLDAPLERLELGGKTEQVQTTGAQLFDKNSVVNGVIIADGSVTDNAPLYVTSDYIPVKPSVMYACTETGSKRLKFFDIDKQPVQKINFEDANVERGGTFTTGETTRFIRLSLLREKLDSIMLNEGSKSISYEPYTGGKPSPSQEYQQEIKNSGKRNEETQKYEVNVKVTGKNLLNLRNPSVRFDRCILQGDGSIKSDIRSNYYFCSIYVDDPYVVDNIKNDQAITFSIGKGIQNRSITISLLGERVGSVNYQEKSSVPGGNSVSIVPSGFKKVSKIELRFNRSGSLLTDTETVVRDFMIHFGESTPYQPYKEQTLTLTSDRPLTKWDRLVEQGGEIGWLYRSEIDDNVKPSRTDLFPYGFSLYKNQENGTYTYKSTNIKKAIGFQTSYCKQFRNKDAAYQSAELWHYSDQPSMKIQYFNTDIATVEEFIEWMESNPLTMVFKTESATFVPLPQSEQNAIRALKTYYPTTVITADGGEPDPDIKVTYRKEI